MEGKRNRVGNKIFWIVNIEQFQAKMCTRITLVNWCQPYHFGFFVNTMTMQMVDMKLEGRIQEKTT